MYAATHSAARRTSSACAGSALILGMRRSSESSSSSGSCEVVVTARSLLGPALLAWDLLEQPLRRREVRRRPLGDDALQLEPARLSLPEPEQHQPQVEAHDRGFREHVHERPEL